LVALWYNILIHVSVCTYVVHESSIESSYMVLGGPILPPPESHPNTVLIC